VLALSPTARAYFYHAVFVPRDGSEPVTVPREQPEARATGVLLLDTLVQEERHG